MIIYTLTFTTDCIIGDDYNQTYNSLQPTDTIMGSFGFQVPCNGTVVATHVRGFCIHSERTNQPVSFPLIIFRQEGAVPKLTYHTILAECDNKIHSLPGVEYSFGNVSDNGLNIEVTTDEYIAMIVDITRNCSSSGCLFIPALINESSTHPLLFLEDGEVIDIERASLVTNVSLLLSVTIEPSSDTHGMQL